MNDKRLEALSDLTLANGFSQVYLSWITRILNPTGVRCHPGLSVKVQIVSHANVITLGKHGYLSCLMRYNITSLIVRRKIRYIALCRKCWEINFAPLGTLANPIELG